MFMASKSQPAMMSCIENSGLTFGLNFRPEEETVMKLDYEIHDRDYVIHDPEKEDIHGLIFSVASYF